MTKQTYHTNKARARALAIQWQAWQATIAADYGYYIRWCAIFTAIGRKYGLMREFRENGII